MITTALAVLALGAAPAQASWPDTPVARLEALAELQTLNADLLSHDIACAETTSRRPPRSVINSMPARIRRSRIAA
jgi:hypothetical protein